jgi:hypothetical protein
MRFRRDLPLTVIASVIAGAAALAASDRETNDPLATEVERWTAFVRDHPSADETWTQIKGASEPVLARAQEALRDGQRLLALQRLAAARMYLAASVYVEQKPAARKDGAAFEAEWTRREVWPRSEPARSTPRGTAARRGRALASGEASGPVYCETSPESCNIYASTDSFRVKRAARARRLRRTLAPSAGSPAGPSVRRSSTDQDDCSRLSLPVDRRWQESSRSRGSGGAGLMRRARAPEPS